MASRPASRNWWWPACDSEKGPTSTLRDSEAATFEIRISVSSGAGWLELSSVESLSAGSPSSRVSVPVNVPASPPAFLAATDSENSSPTPTSLGPESETSPKAAGSVSSPPPNT
ncbi:hypothetical protein [Halorussus salinus]|uniref:hypothetical protein n=1 Tax=Halorussus salinus TaxID=1364935 RepID=UPI001093005E|nr:hypothetical protein [Halorussus salinus]